MNTTTKTLFACAAAVLACWSCSTGPLPREHTGTTSSGESSGAFVPPDIPCVPVFELICVGLEVFEIDNVCHTVSAPVKMCKLGCDDGECGESKPPPAWCIPVWEPSCMGGDAYVVDHACDLAPKFIEACKVGCQNGQCEPLPEPDILCIGDDLYEILVGDPPRLVQDCPFGCESGQCKADPCSAKHDHKECFAGDLYYFDNCGNPTVVAMTCPAGCVDDECFNPPESKEEIMEVTPLDSPWHNLQLTDGDEDFSGNGPIVSISAKLEISGQSLMLDVDAVYLETSSDSTTGESHTFMEIYKAPEGCTLQEILSATTSTCEYQDIDHAYDYCANIIGPVALFTSMGDNSGNDVIPDKSGFSLKYNPIKLRISCE